MSTLATLSLLVFVSQIPDPSSRVGDPNALDLTVPALSVVRDSDGSVYAHGNRWKMTFDANGATFIPILGGRAPRNVGIRFAFSGGAVPSIEGNRVVIPRDGFVERYDLAVDHVEQSFEFAARPQDGDLVVRVPIETELEAAGRDEKGLRFTAHDLGAVGYGDATAIDASGRRIDMPSIHRDGAIEIVVPDAFLDGATFPLIVDPIIQAFPIDSTLTVASDPDVVYAPNTDEWFVAYEREISATDRDIVVRRFSATGTFLADFLVAATTDDTFDPAITERSGVVVTAWDNGGHNGMIQARRIVAASSSLGTTFNVTTPNDNTDVAFPDIGATVDAVSAPFQVVWRRASSSEIRGRTISDSAAVGAQTPAFVAAPANRGGSISQKVTAGAHFMLATTTLNQSGHLPIIAVRNATGAQLSSVVIVGPPLDTPGTVDIAGDSNDALLVWTSQDANGVDLLAKSITYGVSGPNDYVLGSHLDIGAIDHGGSESVDQIDVKVAFDGARFLVVYAEEKAPGAATDVVASVWGKNGATLVPMQPRTPISIGGIPELDVAVASAGFDRPGENLIAWSEQVSVILNNDNVDGALFSTLEDGGTTIIQTGCGGPEPLLATSTPVIAGGPLDVSIIGSVSPMLVAGLPTHLPLCPGMAGCVLGATPILLSPVPTSFSVALPTTAQLIGVPFALQVIDLLPASATGAICGPPKYAQKFRVSDTRVITIQ